MYALKRCDALISTEEDFLLETLDTDDGARGIGELGIGCNPGIDRYVRNAYFDEKINGTVHVALGGGFEYLGVRTRPPSTGTSSKPALRRPHRTGRQDRPEKRRLDRLSHTAVRPPVG
jgi:hypothetical protein